MMRDKSDLFAQLRQSRKEEVLAALAVLLVRIKCDNCLWDAPNDQA
jgi:hypothetical protein